MDKDGKKEIRKNYCSMKMENIGEKTNSNQLSTTFFFFGGNFILFSFKNICYITKKCINVKQNTELIQTLF